MTVELKRNPNTLKQKKGIQFLGLAKDGFVFRVDGKYEIIPEDQTFGVLNGYNVEIMKGCNDVAIINFIGELKEY